MPVTVHFLQFGHSACMMEGPPAEWPKGHTWTSDWDHVTCEQCILGKDEIQTFKVSTDRKSITCLRCQHTSHNHNDVEYHYCGRCCVFHDNIWPPARKWWIEHPDIHLIHMTDKELDAAINAIGLPSDAAPAGLRRLSELLLQTRLRRK